PVVNGGQPDLARARRRRLGQVRPAPEDVAFGGPAEVEFQLRPRRLGRCRIGTRDGSPAVRAWVGAGHGIFRRSPALTVAVEPDARAQYAPGGGRDVLGLVFRVEGVIRPRPDRALAAPAPVRRLIALAREPEPVAVRSLPGLLDPEHRRDLGAGGV